MKKITGLYVFLIVAACMGSHSVLAAGDRPDTVRTGIYITSVHDIDFKQK